MAANQRARLIDARMSPEPYHNALVLAANAQRNRWRESADRPPRTYRAEAPGGTELRRRTPTEGGRAFSEPAILARLPREMLQSAYVGCRWTTSVLLVVGVQWVSALPCSTYPAQCLF